MADETSGQAAQTGQPVETTQYQQPVETTQYQTDRDGQRGYTPAVSPTQPKVTTTTLEPGPGLTDPPSGTPTAPPGTSATPATAPAKQD
jgi:hypothetical protein